MNRKEVLVAALGMVIGFLVGFTILNVKNIELKHQLVQADQKYIDAQKQRQADPFQFGGPSSAFEMPPAVPKRKVRPLPPPPPPEPVVETDPRRQVKTI